MSAQYGIPDEINDHLKIFGKPAEDVDYNISGEYPFCNARMDEFGYCPCGGSLGVSWRRAYTYKIQDMPKPTTKKCKWCNTEYEKVTGYPVCEQC